MNVAFDPWIPVVAVSGERRLASLCSVLVEGEKYIDLAVRPHERISLMRLFLCVAHAALDGPKNYDEWREVPKRLPEAVRTYLTAWKDSFDLFHPSKPWLQMVNLTPSRENDEKSFTPIAKLDFALASGSNSTLFDHGGSNNSERLFDLTQLVLGLISIQNFSTCGLLSRPFWNGVATPNSAKDAPCISSSMYHVFLVGKDLANTICINLCDLGELSFLMKGSPNKNWFGRPVWEQMPRDATDIESTETFLGRLMPISRSIRFLKGGTKMLYGEALRYSIYPDFPQEFNTSVAIRKVKNKQERFLVGARLNVRPWRQLDAILQFNLPGETNSYALNLNHLEGKAIDIWVGALVRNPGKQDILDSVESRFHISRKFRTETGCAAYANEVQTAQNVSNLLDTAVYFYRIELDPSEGKGLGSTAISHYWTTIESNLQILMNHIDAIGTDDVIPTKQMWRSRLYAAARDAYRIACGKETPRQMKAFAIGWQKLTTKKDKSKTDKKDKETMEENS